MKTRSVFVVGIATGVAIGTFFAGIFTAPSATAQIPALTPPAQPRQQARTLLDERRQELVYANAYRMYPAGEEVIADMGMHIPNINNQGQGPEMILDNRMRLVMTYATAKRFRDALTEIIDAYEKINGPIRTGPASQPAAPAGGAASPAPSSPASPLTVPRLP